MIMGKYDLNGDRINMPRKQSFLSREVSLGETAFEWGLKTQ